MSWPDKKYENSIVSTHNEKHHNKLVVGEKGPSHLVFKDVNFSLTSVFPSSPHVSNIIGNVMSTDSN